MVAMLCCRQRLTRPLSSSTTIIVAMVLFMSGMFPAHNIRAQGMPEEPPVAVDDGVFTESDRSVSIDILANDYGISAGLDRTSVNIILPPESGTASVDPNTGVIEFTPVPGVGVTDSIVYEVSDQEGRVSNPAWVWISVVHDPPVTSDDWDMTYEESIVIDVLGNDSGGTADIDPGTVEIVTQPSHGSTSVDSATGAVTYTPGALFFGMDWFEYVVEDEHGVVSNAARVEISVMNEPPTITAFYCWQDSSGTWVFEGMVSDEHPETVTIELGGVLSGTTTPDSSGYFSTIIDLPAGSYGSGSATAIDEVGQEYGPEYAEIFPY